MGARESSQPTFSVFGALDIGCAPVSLVKSLSYTILLEIEDNFLDLNQCVLPEPTPHIHQYSYRPVRQRHL